MTDIVPSIQRSCGKFKIKQQPFVFTFDKARMLISDTEAQGFRGVRSALQKVAKV